MKAVKAAAKGKSAPKKSSKGGRPAVASSSPAPKGKAKAAPKPAPKKVRITTMAGCYRHRVLGQYAWSGFVASGGVCVILL